MILTLNCGSQSVVIAIFEGEKLKEEISLNNLTDKNYKLKLESKLEELGGKYSPQAVGHRVVHGGEGFRETVVIDEKKIKKLEEFNHLAPLHNPKNLMGIKAARRVFNEAIQVAIFDTQFYRDLPVKAYQYGLPQKIRKNYGFRRFGFHGISHEYASKKAAQESGFDFKKAKIISAHLGGGCSVTAIKHGKAIDTSMGHTPLEGVVMMTRSGDVDPGIVLELARKEGVEEADKLLNKESGMMGLAGTQDMLKIIKKSKKGDRKSQLALNVFSYRVKKYISAYYGAMGGVDLISFTGSIGNGDQKIRKMILEGLPFLDGVKVVKVKPNEELAIARKTRKIIV